MWNRTLPTILFTHYGDNWIRGSERCLLDLMKYIDRRKYNILLWCNSEVLSEKANELDVHVVLTDFTVLFSHDSSASLPDYARIISIGNHLVRKYRVNLIHSNSAAPNLWLNPIARTQRIPLLVHIHSHYTLRERMTLGLHHVPMLVGVSPAVLSEFVHDGTPRDRLNIITNGVDGTALTEQATQRTRDMVGVHRNEILIATTGSLIHRKGIDITIAATVSLHQQGFPVHLVIFGEGPERIALQRQIHSAKAQRYVHLLGETKHVAGLIKGGVDVFVTASRKEAFGLAIAEASYSEVPVVAPRSGEFPNIVIDGETGLLFDQQEPASLELAIEKLIADRSAAKAMGLMGKRHIEKNYDLQHYVTAFEATYDTMLKDSTMKMSWLSHWKLLDMIKLGLRKLFNLQKPVNSRGLAQ